MSTNELYYLVGLAGAGKTTVCKQLANSLKDSIAVQTSGQLKEYLLGSGLESFKQMNLLPDNEKSKVVDGFHQSLSAFKEGHSYTFLDGHMMVDDPINGNFVSAMASENFGVATGIIFLDTPCREIESNISRDIGESKRDRRCLSLEELRSRAEAEWGAAESFAQENCIKIGVLPNSGMPENALDDVIFLNDYYLSGSSALRNEYLQQFDPLIKPAELRRRHYSIGEAIANSYCVKTGMPLNDCQVLSVPRSGNLLALGFVSSFDGNFLSGNDLEDIQSELDISKPLIIIDSVIDSGNTVKRILSNLPENYVQPVDVICLAINFKALKFIQSLEGKVSFHCLGFSNKEQRPVGTLDMGARLYGTSN